MNPLATRRGVEELARLLDGAAGADNGAGSGQLALVERLRAVAPALDRGAIPAPAFRTALRTRLVAVAAVQTPAPTASSVRAAAQWSRRRGVQRRLGVTAGALAGVVALTGIGVAGSRSLPGAPLYGLKRGAEDVQLALADGDVAAGTRQLQFARTRLREVVALADGAGEVLAEPVASAGLVAAGTGALDGRLRATLTDMDRETRSGYRLLAAAYRRTSRDELLRRLATFSAAQRGGLTGVLPILPAGARSQAQASLALVTVIGDNASALLGRRACPAGCPPAAGGSAGTPGPRGGRATTGPVAPAPPGRHSPATRAPAPRAPAPGAPGAPAPGAPIRPPAGHSPRTPGVPRPPGGNTGTPATLPPLPPVVPLPPAPLPPVPLPPVPIPSVLPLPLPVPVLPVPVVPVPTRLPTGPPLLP